jgi:ribose 5-phosphate isomerase B
MLKLQLPMRIAIAADHAGFPLKETLRGWLRARGHEVEDFGTHSTESTDYPDFAAAVAHRVASGGADRGVLVCYTGTGMSIAANKVIGIRAAVGTSDEVVRLTRSHNDANVLTLGARFIQSADAERLIDLFLTTEFDGGSRHARRIGKIADLERAAPTRTEEEQKQLYEA